MQVIKLTFNPFQENTYILYDSTGDCVIVDPGCSDQSEQKRLIAGIESNELNPVMLLNTHAHLDHVLGNAFVIEKYKLPFYIHKDAVALLRAVPLMGKAYGVSVDPSPEPDAYMEEGKTINFGNTQLEVFHTPGHSPGSVSLYHRDSDTLIAGDVLFAGSIGRTDLPGGDYDTLITSIKEKLLTLPDKTAVLSGHGPDTTIGNEKRTNPFLQS